MFFDLQVLLSQVALNQEIQDQVMWKHHQSRFFSIKTFIELVGLQQYVQIESQCSFNNIWRDLDHLQAKLMVWFAIIGRLKAKDRRHKFNII